MGASSSYTLFAGAAEVFGGLLLAFRRTTLFGALVCAGVMSQVVMLNFCYDVPVKLFSSQLLALAIFLIAPDAKRLWHLFVLGRPVAPAQVRPLIQRRWMRWSIASVTAGLFAYLTLGSFLASYSMAEAAGYFGPPPPLAGIWDVVEFSREGRIVPPLESDSTRWKQVLVENSAYGAAVGIRPMTGLADWRLMELNETARRIKLIDPQKSGKPAIALSYEEPARGVLVFSGEVNGQSVRIKLSQVPPEKLLLTNRGFHWINEMPFNR
jgi:hypothetical protein